MDDPPSLVLVQIVLLGNIFIPSPQKTRSRQKLNNKLDLKLIHCTNTYAKMALSKKKNDNL